MLECWREGKEDGQGDGGRYRILSLSQFTILVSLDAFSHVHVWLSPLFFFFIPREVDIFSLVISSVFFLEVLFTKIYIVSVLYVHFSLFSCMYFIIHLVHY